MVEEGEGAILSTQATTYWDSVARSWGEKHPFALWRAHSDSINQDLLRRWLPARPVERLLKTDVFDESCSHGLLPFLEDRARSVIGIDVSQESLQTTQRRSLRSRLVRADVRGLPFASGSFDCVVSNSTLDHFTSKAQIALSLAELNRVLRPGGTLVITLDNMANPLVWLRNHLPLQWLTRSGIVPYFVGESLGPRALRSHVEGAGFEVAETTAIMHCPRVAAVAAGRLLRSRGERAKRRFLRCLSPFEALGALPTRYLSGYFVAARAVKPLSV